MTTIKEGDLTFSFPADCRASKYDDWSFCRSQFHRVAGGCKAIDILCVEDDVAWLIEIKDYRQHPRTKAIDIADELSIKIRDTLAGLASAAKMANKAGDLRHARQSLASRRRWRVVLHLEQPATQSKLRPKAIDTASLLSKLRMRKLKADAKLPVAEATCLIWRIRVGTRPKLVVKDLLEGTWSFRRNDWNHIREIFHHAPPAGAGWTVPIRQVREWKQAAGPLPACA